MKFKLLALVLVVLGLGAPRAWSIDCNLLTAGNTCNLDDGASVQQIPNQSTGTGVINPFVRLNPGGSQDAEQGYNTDGRPTAFDENSSPQFTRSLRLSDVPIIGGRYQFLLDINQTGEDPLLSLNSIQLYTNTTSGSVTSTNLASGGPLGTLVYNLDRLQNWEILLDYSLNSGSGSGDMFLFVPTSLFTASCPAQNCFIYLYSQFGTPPGVNNTNDGFEEWSILGTQSGGPQGKIPEPSALILLGSGLLVVAGFARRRFKEGK